MNSNEVFQKVFYKAYKNRKTTNFPQKSENIENKLNSFVGSNNQKSLPRKTKILNKSVTNFEVKMQMAKGCEKWKKDRNSWQMKNHFGIGIYKKKR